MGVIGCRGHVRWTYRNVWMSGYMDTSAAAPVAVAPIDVGDEHRINVEDKLLIALRALSQASSRRPMHRRKLSHRRSGRPTESGDLEFDLAGAPAHRADHDLHVVAQLRHQFQQLGFADAAELAAGDA